MLIYLLILIVPLVLGSAYALGARINHNVFYGYFLVLLLFTGLRDEVGTDWTGYLNKFEVDRWRQLDEITFLSEPGFFIVNYASNLLGWEIYGVNVVCAFFFLSGVFAFAKTTANPWLAIAIVTPYLVYIISMSGIRQSAALGIGFIALAWWPSLSVKSKIFIILLASTFHTTALFFLVFVVLEREIGLGKKMLVGSALAILLFSVQTDVSDSYDKYSGVYFDYNVESKGALFHVALSAFPAVLYLIYYKRIFAAGMANQLVTLCALMAIVAVPMIQVSSTGVSRISLYFSFIQMWIYPALIRTFSGARPIIIGLCVAIILSIFVGYFQFADHAYTYVPYKSVLFGLVAW